MEVLLDTSGRLDVKSLFLLTLHLFLLKAAADCPKPEGGENIVLTDATLLLNSFPDQIEVSLECANGYIKESGSGNIMCIDGHWTEPDLICKKKDCGPPEPQPHMTFQPADQTLFGATIQVICDKGYEVDGANFRQCYATGWSGNSKCEVVECEKPDNVTNGMNSWNSEDYPTYGEIITYQCNDGYNLTGNDTIMCDETGDYNHPPPTCIGRTTMDTTTTNVITTAAMPTQEASTTTGSSSTETTQTIPASTVSPLSTVSLSTRGGRDMVTDEDTTTASTVTTATTSSQEQPRTVDGNKNTGYTAVIISVFMVLLVSSILVCFAHKYFLRKKGSYDTREDQKPALLSTFQTL